MERLQLTFALDSFDSNRLHITRISE